MLRLAIAAIASAGCGRVGFDGSVDAADGSDAPELTAGLVAHWRLDEIGGSIAVDSAGAATGTLTNMDPLTDWVTGHPGTGGGLDLDGVDDYVAVPSVMVTNGRYTIAFWVKLYDWSANTGYNVWSGVLGPVEAYQWFIMVKHEGATGRLSHYGEVGTTNDHFVAGYLDWGVWYHAALVSDGSSSRWYLDGALTTESTTHDSTCTPIVAMASKYTDASATVRFKGVLDDVRIYDRALSATEVGALYSWTETAAAR